LTRPSRRKRLIGTAPANAQSEEDRQNLRPHARYKKEVMCHRLPGGAGRKELAMAGKSETKDTKVVRPPKRYWHLYSLQSLQTHKLAEIVNKVLRREYLLIK
jgi:hypothetical protein